MVTVQSRLAKVQSALTSIPGLSVYHYWRPKMNPPYCVWQESNSDALWANDHAEEIRIEGTVDYYTKAEFDPNVDAIISALNGVESLGWRLQDVLYEDETNLIHYSWLFYLA